MLVVGVTRCAPTPWRGSLNVMGICRDVYWKVADCHWFASDDGKGLAVDVQAAGIGGYQLDKVGPLRPAI